MSGNNEKIDLNFERFQIIQEWCIANFPSISAYVKVKIKNRDKQKKSKSTDLQFENERKEAHAQLKNNIVAYGDKIKSIISSFESNLNNLVSQPILPLGKVYFSQQKMNLDVRKLLFINQLIHKLKIKILTLKIDSLLQVTDKINKSLELIDKSPNDSIIIIEKSFFEMELNKKKRHSHNITMEQASSYSSSNPNIPIQDLNSSNPDPFEFSSTPSFNSSLNNGLISLDSSLTLSFGAFSTSSVEPTLKQYQTMMIRLTHYTNFLSNQIANNYPKPLWVKDYSLFLEKIVKMCLPRFDSELSYLLPQECEVSLSRFLFGNSVKSSEPVDVILRSFSKIAPNVFMIELMNMCYKLVPSKLLNEFDPEELSICLTFMFRLLINRVYEKSFDGAKNDISNEEKKLAQVIDSYNEKKNKYLKMKSLPMSAFVWPHDYIPDHPFSNGYTDQNIDSVNVGQINNISANINNNAENTDNNSNNTSNSQNNDVNMNTSKNSQINGGQITDNENKSQNSLTEESMKMPICQFFRADYYFLPAIEFLELSSFCTNPIDILYYVHKCLISVQKAAIIHSINKRKNRQAKPCELNQVICFDDLFGLTLGVFLASDVPDVFALNWYVQNYSPRNELSPPLEYAKANLEGLTQHIATVELDPNLLT